MTPAAASAAYLRSAVRTVPSVMVPPPFSVSLSFSRRSASSRPRFVAAAAAAVPLRAAPVGRTAAALSAVSSPGTAPRRTLSSSSSSAAARHDAASDGEGTAAAAAAARRRVRPDKAPLVVTDRAAERLQELLDGEGGKGAAGIRLGVRRRGCNGLSYTLDYVRDPAQHVRDAKVVASNGVAVYVEPMALFSVVGTTMDWTETELTSEFTFQNPNSKGECGCGESFTV